MKNINNIKKIATYACEKSGKMLVKEFKKFDRSTVKLKLHHEIVTKCDLSSERIIINEVKKNFPDHSILSEEAGEDKIKSDWLWIIDPIDGTTNFSMHNPMFCISVGIAYKGKIVFGIVHAPVVSETYIAIKGRGATLNNKKIKVSNIAEGKVLNAFCHGREEIDIKRAMKYYFHQKLNGLDCRQMGSAAIELAMVASGRLESIVIPGAHSWDVAAGILLVREAGGKVTDFSGSRWSLESRDMFASNGKVHNNTLDIFKKIKIYE